MLVVNQTYLTNFLKHRNQETTKMAAPVDTNRNIKWVDVRTIYYSRALLPTALSALYQSVMLSKLTLLFTGNAWTGLSYRSGHSSRPILRSRTIQSCRLWHRSSSILPMAHYPNLPTRTNRRIYICNGYRICLRFEAITTDPWWKSWGCIDRNGKIRISSSSEARLSDYNCYCSDMGCLPVSSILFSNNSFSFRQMERLTPDCIEWTDSRSVTMLKASGLEIPVPQEKKVVWSRPWSYWDITL